MQSSKAISQLFAVIVVFAVVVAAFGGYAVSLAGERTATQVITLMNTTTKSLNNTQSTTEYVTSPVTQTLISTITLSNAKGTLQTITEQIVEEYVGDYTVYVFGNCTSDGGTIALRTSTTITDYVFPSNSTGTIYVTVTTIRTQSNIISTHTVDSSLSPQTITIQSGTVTTYSVQTCPTYS
ncbi:MAG: hypothetical protein JRN20_11060 [Nitrososphaerota archaeon]|nr:hypothetical protein [Nitrososphaerota archaeon]